jgi:hypothetical protein
MSNISVRNDVICMLENLISFNCERWISTINTQHFESNQAASSLSLPIDRCCTCAQRVFNTTLLCSFLSDFTLFASNVNAVRTRLSSHCPENSRAFVSALFCYPFCGSDKQHMDQYDHPLSTSTAPSDGISRCMFGLRKCHEKTASLKEAHAMDLDGFVHRYNYGTILVYIHVCISNVDSLPFQQRKFHRSSLRSCNLNADYEMSRLWRLISERKSWYFLLRVIQGCTEIMRSTAET